MALRMGGGPPAVVRVGGSLVSKVMLGTTEVYASAATTPVWNGLPRLSVSGNRIVTPDGQTVLLRGANFMRDEYDPGRNTGFEQGAIPHMAADWKGNVVMRGFATLDFVNNTGGYRDRIDSIVAYCKSAGCYLVLAARSQRRDGVGDPYDQFQGIPPVQAEDGLAAAALRYKAETHVMFASQVEANNSGGYQPTWLDVRDYTERCIDKIRAQGHPDVLVMSTGTNFGRGINGAVANPIRRGNVVYKSHYYPEDRDPASDITTWFGGAVDAGLPVFIGELGEGGVQTLLGYCDSKGLGYAAWVFEAYAPPTLISTDAGPYTPTAYGAVVRTNMRLTPPIPAPLGGSVVVSVPGAPTGIVATASNLAASVAFTAPASNGGAAVVEYRVSRANGAMTAVLGGTSPIVVGGLTNGTAYTFTVAARNAAGWGAESAVSNSVTPATTTQRLNETFGVGVGGFLAEPSTIGGVSVVNATSLRRDTTRDAGGALAWTVGQAGPSRVRAPNVGGFTPGTTAPCVVRVSHSASGGQLFNLQGYEEDAAGGYMGFLFSSSVIVAEGAAFVQIAQTFTAATTGTSRFRLLIEAENLPAGAVVYVADVTVT